MGLAFTLGKQYLSDFREDDIRPPKHRLDVALCRDCSLLQLLETVPRDEMYHERYGFKSGVNDTMRADLKDVVDSILNEAPLNWLDIACNDGTLLSFVPEYIRRTGVDPIKKYCEEAARHADLIVNDFFSQELLDTPRDIITEGELFPVSDLLGPFDVITSISVFYDIEDLPSFVGAVKSVLAENGVWVIQQNYILETLKQNAIDNFCHEHLTYFSLASLEHLLSRFDLEVTNVAVSGINGGSLRTHVRHKGQRQADESVVKQREIEKTAALDSLDTYRWFAGRAKINVEALLRAVPYKRPVYIYGASTRGATLWQLAGFRPDAAVERNPEKVGKVYSALGIPIISEEEARANHPKAMIVGPWWCRDEIVAREADYLNDGGRLIFPLPSVEIVERTA
jgi:SAM-dependent methyltransferase